jgi:hypothetical protein
LALTGVVGLIWYAQLRGHGNLRELANYWRVFVGNLAPRPAMAWGTVLVRAAAMKPAAIGLAALFTLALACGKESAPRPGTDARPTDARADTSAGTGGSGGGGTGGSGGTGGGGGTGGSGGSGGTSGSGGGSDGRDMIEAPAETGSDAGGQTLDECFAGLPAGEGGWQDATKASSDGAYRMRLALETGQRGGTSGSYAWEPLRFALTAPGASICITDRVMLAEAYMSSHHNCADVLTVTSGGRRYVISNPDSAIDYADPTKYRRPATLTVFEGNTMVVGPILLSTVACNRSSTPDGRCRSGGPCVAQPAAY